MHHLRLGVEVVLLVAAADTMCQLSVLSVLSVHIQYAHEGVLLVPTPGLQRIERRPARRGGALC